MLMRNADLVHLASFGDQAPAAAQNYAQAAKRFSFHQGANFRGFESFHIIQTTRVEAPTPLLDMVVLAKLPIDKSGPTTPSVLLRNRQFAANPNSEDSKLSTSDWTIEDNQLPPDAQRVWASGGHQNPVYYLYTENDLATERKLFRRSGAGATWKEIVAIGSDLLPYPSHPVFGTTSYGPAFVNPYDRNHLLVITVKGIKVSHDGGTTFQDDPVLTALITGSGKYPLTGDYRLTGNFRVGRNVTIATRAAQFATLSQVAFYRDDPAKLAVAAPYTGGFYRDEACGYWQSLTPYLPRPFTAVSSVGIDHQGIYVAMEGRSIHRIGAYEFAPMATYFSRDGLGATQVARLMKADGGPVAAANVTVSCATEDGVLLFQGVVTSDAAGVISFPLSIASSGTYVVHLDYSGKTSLASATTSLLFTP